VNYLIVEALERYHHFYGDSFRVEVPVGSGRMMNLREAAHEISRRLVRLFLLDGDGRRACHGDDTRFAADPHWRDLILFYEYFTATPVAAAAQVIKPAGPHLSRGCCINWIDHPRCNRRCSRTSVGGSLRHRWLQYGADTERDGRNAAACLVKGS